MKELIIFSGLFANKTFVFLPYIMLTPWQPAKAFAAMKASAPMAMSRAYMASSTAVPGGVQYSLLLLQFLVTESTQATLVEATPHFFFPKKIETSLLVT